MMDMLWHAFSIFMGTVIIVVGFKITTTDPNKDEDVKEWPAYMQSVYVWLLFFMGIAFMGFGVAVIRSF